MCSRESVEGVPKAVLTSVHPFAAGLVVGAHQVARELARRGWQVALLSDPASLVHLVGAAWHPGARHRVRVAMHGPCTAGGLVALTPFALLPLARDLGAGSSTILRVWPWLSLPNVPSFLTRHGLRDVDLLMFDSPISACLRSWLRARRTVLRLFDDTTDEPPWPAALTDQARALARAADLVTITAPALAERAAALGARRVHLMPNGADVEHFARPTAEPEDLVSVPRPRVVYVGALAPWVNFELMNNVAARMPNASFVWIGPGPTDAIARRPNVRVLGARSYESLPGYLQHCDVAVIPFDRDRHRRLVDSVHPLKLYDYLAAGLPVVATPWTELIRIAAPVRFADQPEAFAEAIADAIRGGRIDARAFLAGATWAARVDSLLEAAGLAS
jgi:glycosyltransferase involved in cell wall biosynthesis